MGAISLNYRNAGVTYAVLSGVAPNASLYEKRITVQDINNTARYAYFERDDAPETSVVCVPPLGSRLKIHDGTRAYRALLAAQRVRGNYSEAWPYFLEDEPGGTYLSWTLVAQTTIDVDRRSRWTDNNKNIAVQIYSTVKFGTGLDFKVSFEYTDAAGVSQTDWIDSYSEAQWPAAFGPIFKDILVYPFAANGVVVKFWALGGMGTQNYFALNWLAH